MGRGVGGRCRPRLSLAVKAAGGRIRQDWEEGGLERWRDSIGPRGDSRAPGGDLGRDGDGQPREGTQG